MAANWIPGDFIGAVCPQGMLLAEGISRGCALEAWEALRCGAPLEDVAECVTASRAASSDVRYAISTWDGTTLRLLVSIGFAARVQAGGEEVLIAPDNSGEPIRAFTDVQLWELSDSWYAQVGSDQSPWPVVEGMVHAEALRARLPLEVATPFGGVMALEALRGQDAQADHKEDLATRDAAKSVLVDAQVTLPGSVPVQAGHASPDAGADQVAGGPGTAVEQPAEAEVAPADVAAVPFEAEVAPSDVAAMPADVAAVPFEAEIAPSEATAPAEAGDVLAYLPVEESPKAQMPPTSGETQVDEQGDAAAADRVADPDVAVKARQIAEPTPEPVSPSVPFAPVVAEVSPFAPEAQTGLGSGVRPHDSVFAPVSPLGEGAAATPGQAVGLGPAVAATSQHFAPLAQMPAQAETAPIGQQPPVQQSASLQPPVHPTGQPPMQQGAGHLNAMEDYPPNPFVAIFGPASS